MNATTPAEVLTQPEVIQVGDLVRSLDFPHDDRPDAQGCYVEGVVEAIGKQPFDGYEVERYTIRVTRRMWQGKPDKPPFPHVVYPPVNGSASWLGHVYSGVIKVTT